MVNTFTLNGQSISWSFWQRVRNRRSNDFEAWEIFFRARNARNVINYVSAGMKSGTIYRDRVEEDKNPQEKKLWIAKMIQENSRTSMTSMKQAIKEWADAL